MTGADLVDTRSGDDDSTGRGQPEMGLRVTLVVGAAMWLLLLVVGFFAPGGWVWGMPGPIGHIENFMISLWLVTMVLAPLLAAREPLARTTGIQVYLLGVIAIAVSSVRGEHLELVSDAPPLLAATFAAGLVIWIHPSRRRLLRV